MTERPDKEPSPDRRGNLVAAFARAYPRRTAVALACLVAAGVAEGLGVSVLVPLVGLAAERPGGDAPTELEQTVLGVLEALGLRPTLELLLVAVMIGMVFKAALLLLANRQVGYTVAAVATDLRLELIRSLLHTRWSYFVHQPLGAFANAVASEARRAADGYLHAATISAMLIQSLAYACVALFVSWQATLAALFGGAFVIAALHWLVRASRRAGARQTRLSKSLLGRLTDVLQSIKSLKAMGRERLVGPLLESETERLNRALRREVFSKEARQALQEPILFLFVAAALYGAVRFWTIPTSSVIVLVLLSTRLVTGLGKVQKELQRMVTCESAYWSIRGMIDEASGMREVSHGDLDPVLAEGIRFHDVGLAYDDRWILRHASATIPAGELTVIVGASGAGKTTLADLVIGLLQPTEGEILIDGVAMRRIATEAWRRRIGYVPQETLLLHESIRVNVTLGDPELGDADVEEALRAADAWEFVRELPQGTDSIVGERGLRLSGGQRQRIALARALAHRPSLLILDEATAALDPETEAGISLTLGKLRGRVTLLAICHHGTLVTIADRLYAVRGGALEPLAVSTAPATATASAARAPAEALRPTAPAAPLRERPDEEPPR